MKHAPDGPRHEARRPLDLAELCSESASSSLEKDVFKDLKEGFPRQLLIWFVTVAGDILALS